MRKRQNEFDKPEVYSEYEKEILKKKQERKDLDNKSFLDYFIYLTNKRKGSNFSNWLSASKHLNEYGKGNIRFGDLNQMYCEDFKDFLINVNANTYNDKKLAPNTVFSYFNKFKAALKQAFKDGYLPTDVNSTVSSVKQAETHRNFLTFEELNKLANTECEVPVLKKAALFSALTGLRFVDIENLTWRELEFIKGNGYFIKFTQQKTDGTEYMPISEQAYKILGTPKDPDEKVFEDFVYSTWLKVNYLFG